MMAFIKLRSDLYECVIQSFMPRDAGRLEKPHDDAGNSLNTAKLSENKDLPFYSA